MNIIQLTGNICQPAAHRILLTGQRTPLTASRTDLAGKILQLTILGNHLTVPGIDLATHGPNLDG